MENKIKKFVDIAFSDDTDWVKDQINDEIEFSHYHIGEFVITMMDEFDEESMNLEEWINIIKERIKQYFPEFITSPTLTMSSHYLDWTL